MKVKVNNQKKLIIKKQNGGDIPKFYEPWSPFKNQTQKSNELQKVPTQLDRRFREQLFVMKVGSPEQKAAALFQYYKDKGDTAQAMEYFKKMEMIKRRSQNSTINIPNKEVDTSVKGSKPKGNKGTPNSINIPKTTNTSISSFTNNGTEELTGNFGQAFQEARRRGLTQFNWKGASYGTRMANENDATWRNNMSNAAAKYTATLPTEKELEQKELKPENTIVETQKPTNTLNTPYTYWYQQSVLNNKPEMSRHMLQQATQDVRNGVRDASYYGESADLISSLSKADQDSAKNYIYNMWNTDADVANREGRKYFTESQGLTFGEPNNKYPRMIDKIANWYNQNKSKFTFAKNGSKLISRKK